MSLLSGSSGRTLKNWPPLTVNMSTTSAIEGLRARMARHGIGYYLVLTQDEHDSEYVAATDERRAFISHFTGSAGTAIIGLDSAELATDGRYYLQAESELPKGWALRREGTSGVSPWYEAVAAAAKKSQQHIGVDPKFIKGTISDVIRESLKGSSVELRPIKENLVDAVWTDKPPQPAEPVTLLPDTITGQSTASKLVDLRKSLTDNHACGIFLYALDEIAWLFNLRGSDIAYNPVFKSFALVTDDRVVLYVDDHKLSGIRDKLGEVEIKPYDEVFSDAVQLAQSIASAHQDDEKAELKTGGKTGETPEKLWLPAGASWALVEAVGGTKNIITQMSPVTIAKSMKNSIEIDGQKRAQLKCGHSVVSYLSWVDSELKRGNTSISEYDGSMKLLEIRKKLEDFVGPSFETISSVGPNAAVIHYAPKPDTKHFLSTKEIYLLDSGCQFTHGTTDTTRTVHFGTPRPEEIRAYTLVLKGHVALARAVFPVGTNGYQVDILARQFLWREGLDFRHGTGHGVGAFLNVHEGPMGIGSHIRLASVPLKVGNLISNEPGYYEDNKYGIRIESLIVVKKAKTLHRFNEKGFLEFETVTLVPFARNLIDVSLLDQDERDWINAYHARVRAALLPGLDETAKAYLLEHTEPL